MLRQPFTVAGFYRDIATVAYSLASGSRVKPLPKPKLMAPKGAGNLGEMMDGDILTSTLFRYANPLKYELEASDDGKVWRKIAVAAQSGNNPTATDFPAVTVNLETEKKSQ